MPNAGVIAHNARVRLAAVADELASGPSLESQVSLHREAVLALHLLSCERLFAWSDVAGFYRGLASAAELWLAFSESSGEDTAVAKSYNSALIGAIVAGRTDLAARMPASTAAVPTDTEYEDEFLSAFVLEGLVTETPAEQLAETCARGLSLGGESETQFEALLALVDRDVPGFGEAFAAWNAQVDNARSERLQSPLARPHEHLHARLWMEGLAVVRLARAAGLPADGPFQRIPPVLMVDPEGTVRGTGVSIDRAGARPSDFEL